MPRETPVSDVMTTEVLTLTSSEPVAQAMQTMVDRGIDGAPVVSDTGEVVGMLSTGDLIVQESRLHFPTILSVFGATIELPGAKADFEESLRKSLGATVGDVMDSDPVVIDAQETVEEAATLMHDHDVSRLPVLSDGVLVGIIARVDILRLIMRDEASS